jgi:hypothetical protein
MAMKPVVRVTALVILATVCWVRSAAAQGPAETGAWSEVMNFPLVAVNSMLLRTGQVLMWDGYEFGGEARLWNPALGTFTAVPIASTNIFCSGQVTLADGRALVVGGHEADFVGLRDANAFDPTTLTWRPVARMAFPRWYPTAMTLPDGRVLVVSGSTTCEGCIADVPELYDPEANAWTQLTPARLTMPLYPFIFVLPDGRILYAGSDEANTPTYALDLPRATWTMIDPDVVPGGSAAMYRPGVVLKAGAPANTFRPAEPAVNTAYILDTRQPSPAWRQVGSMAYPRAYHTLTTLPDGTVAVTGGVQTTGVTTGEAVFAAEIWNPTSGAWSTMASMQVRRSYHSTSLLLPDGRILVAGSGRSGDVNQLNGEIFSPPYLFWGARPTVTLAPATVVVGSQFFVETPDAARIASVALIRLGAVTHAIDMDQRYVPLQFDPAENGVTVLAPASLNITPAGYYMLFLVNAAGVPSIASFLQVAGTSGSTSAVTFDNPVPPGNPGDFLNGVFQGIDFGTGQWRWDGAVAADAKNHIYFDSATGTSRTFTFAPAARVLNSMRLFTIRTTAGTLTLTDNLGQTSTQAITTGSVQLVTTGWTQPSTTVTVTFTAGWELGVDDVVYSNP